MCALAVMSNGGMEKLMNNPMLKNMMEGMQNGGGMPDMSQVSPPRSRHTTPEMERKLTPCGAHAADERPDDARDG